MAVISWTIPPADLTRLLEALAVTYGYQPFLPDSSGNLTVPNPETKPNFVHRMQGVEWRRRVTAYERRIAQEAVPTPPDPDIT